MEKVIDPISEAASVLIQGFLKIPIPAILVSGVVGAAYDELKRAIANILRQEQSIEYVGCPFVLDPKSPRIHNLPDDCILTEECIPGVGFYRITFLVKNSMDITCLIRTQSKILYADEIKTKNQTLLSLKKEFGSTKEELDFLASKKSDWNAMRENVSKDIADKIAINYNAMLKSFDSKIASLQDALKKCCGSIEVKKQALTVAENNIVNNAILFDLLHMFNKYFSFDTNSAMREFIERDDCSSSFCSCLSVQHQNVLRFSSDSCEEKKDDIIDDSRNVSEASDAIKRKIP
jgi:hypothetical protein